MKKWRSVQNSSLQRHSFHVRMKGKSRKSYGENSSSVGNTDLDPRTFCGKIMIEKESIGYKQCVCGKLYARLPQTAFHFFTPEMKRE